ncbi:hypothetical protein CUMW_271390 [Citrus unshiu]|uniref:Uncharacterized protein n=1 Tax=Citrus unshiu TaxID=55188 RepID=A0A2H5QXM1_CITUN|nr:hypothetical protein CUMW_271390 [Citrus unshiu]
MEHHGHDQWDDGPDPISRGASEKGGATNNGTGAATVQAEGGDGFGQDQRRAGLKKAVKKVPPSGFQMDQIQVSQNHPETLVTT